MSEINYFSNFEIEEIYPSISLVDVDKFLKDYQYHSEIDLKKIKTVSDLPNKIKDLLKQVYITKTLKDHSALKARFMQFIKTQEDSEKIDLIFLDDHEKRFCDVILKNSSKNKITACYFIEVLNQKFFKDVINQIHQHNVDIEEKRTKKGKKSQNFKEKISNIALYCGKIDRKVATELERFKKENKDFTIECFLDFTSGSRPFADEDVIIIDDLEIKGFNFSSIDDILSVLKKEKGKGKYSIFRKNSKGFKEILWEGLVFPKQILSKS